MAETLLKRAVAIAWEPKATKPGAVQQIPRAQVGGEASSDSEVSVVRPVDTAQNPPKGLRAPAPRQQTP
jgi:hypothetical protein